MTTIASQEGIRQKEHAITEVSACPEFIWSTPKLETERLHVLGFNLLQKKIIDSFASIHHHPSLLSLSLSLSLFIAECERVHSSPELHQRIRPSVRHWSVKNGIISTLKFREVCSEHKQNGKLLSKHEKKKIPEGQMKTSTFSIMSRRLKGNDVQRKFFPLFANLPGKERHATASNLIQSMCAFCCRKSCQKCACKHAGQGVQGKTRVSIVAFL